jgi:hypothetical protein
MILTPFFFQAEASKAANNCSPQFPSHIPIIWTAEMNFLPKSLWIYQKSDARIFPWAVISNAMVLAGYQDKGIPKPSTNDTCIVDDSDCHCHCTTVCNFLIHPSEGVLSFEAPNQNNSTQWIPDDQTVTNMAWICARQLEVEPNQVIFKGIRSHFNLDTNDMELTNQISGRGAFLSRQFDGIPFIGNGNDGFISEGLYIEFGSYGTIKNFAFIWPELKRCRLEAVVSRQQIMECLKANKLNLFPEGDNDTNYFGRIKSMAEAKSLTITKLEPDYIEGGFVAETNEQGLPKFIAPIGKLEALAVIGDSNVMIHFFCPLLASDADKLLKSPEGGR